MGPLVDRVLTPRIGSEAAIRLVEVMKGIILLASAAVTFRMRSVRRLEAELPDYKVELPG